MEPTVTPDTNAARILAEAVASNMARAQDESAPPVEEDPPASAAFTIGTPMGRFYVRVTAL